MTTHASTSKPPPRVYKYECTACGAATQRDDLMVKRTMFRTMGESGKTVRSRVVAWLCPGCLAEDPTWNTQKLMASPGMADLRDKT